MEHERVERVKYLLATALAKPPGERDAYLDAACDGDLLLRRDVQLYLQGGDRTEKFQFHSDPTQPSIPSGSEPVVLTTTNAPSDPRVGKEFGKYLVQKRVAEGGMGIVYRAVDSQLGREVALKILPEYFSMDTERLKRFRREARATSLLNHPNIVTVFEEGQMDGCEFIASEYVDGETLRDKMAHGPIPFVEMLKIASQVASALAVAHKAGIIHRDIKPENVMIRPDGYVKVLDFGLAKVTAPIGASGGGPSLHNHTVPGMILGTAAYMSPEQAEGTDIDARTDIWGLGVLLYEMAAGKQPFEGPTPSHTLVAILEHEPQPFDHPSAELKLIISTALQKDRAHRFQSAEAMSASIDELKHRLGYFSDQNMTGPSTDDRIAAAAARPSPYRNLVWIVPVAALVLLASVVGLYALITVAFSGGSSANVNTNNVEPSPTTESNTAVVVPTPTEEPSTPPPVYVDPTPIPTPEPTIAVPEATPAPQRERPTVAPTPRPTRQPTPRRTPRPKQDPNCVFTNTCN